VQIACDAGALADAGLRANVELILQVPEPHLIEGHEQKQQSQPRPTSGTKH
jgi:hypothetical protein